MTTSVLIPTWQRPDELAVCLVALNAQTSPPDQVVVTVREDDTLTRDRLANMAASNELPAGFQVVIVGPVPLTAAMNAGLKQTTGGLVALTDDDAEPRPDWLARCASVLAGDASVGGVGGRDWQPQERSDVARVGRVSWFGRVTGNHHLGAGPARDVDLLKGVNACFRGELLRRTGFDPRLRGRGNVTHWELSLCLAIRRAGWRLVYDPTIAVEHRPATRHDGDVNARGGFEASSHANATYNETLAVLEHLSPARRCAAAVWMATTGTSATPGALQIVRRLLHRREAPSQTWQRARATWQGRLAAMAAVTRGAPEAASTFAARPAAGDGPSC